MAFNFFAIFLTLFGFIFGQLYVRIKYYNGSLDKMWLLLFSFPPLSIIPTIFVAFDWIAKGKGGEVLDSSIVTVGLINFVIPLLLDYTSFIEGKLKLIVRPLLIFLATLWVTYNKDISRCSGKDEKPSIYRAINKAAITTMFTAILPVLIGLIPILGTGIMAIGAGSPFLGSIIDGLLKFSSGCLITLMLNMWDNSTDKKVCDSEPSNVSLLFTILLALVSNLAADLLGLAEEKVIGKMMSGERNINFKETISDVYNDE